MRIDEPMYRENEMLELECERCGRKLSVMIKYKVRNIDTGYKSDKIRENQVV